MPAPRRWTMSSAGGRRRNGRCWARPVPASRRCCAIWPVSSRATRPQGSVTVNGQLIQRRGKLSRQVRGARASIGFQQFNLVGRLPVITNVLTGMLPRVPLAQPDALVPARRSPRRPGRACPSWYDDYAFQRASTLSGGQQQRARHRAHAGAERPRHPGRRADRLAGSRILAPRDGRAGADQPAARCAVVVSLHQVDVALLPARRRAAPRQGRLPTAPT